VLCCTVVRCSIIRCYGDTDVFSSSFSSSSLFLFYHSHAIILLSLCPYHTVTCPNPPSYPTSLSFRTVRFPGEEAQYDVFLSYRVASDANIALLIYERLSRRGIRVWFDKMNILPGREWEQEFADGLLTSSCFVCLLSRNAINHPNKPVQNFNSLESSSKADSVLIEWNLALEFAERGLLTKIYPIMIGDKVITETEGEPMVTYTNYFSSGCHPSGCRDIIVESVELRMKAHLERQVLQEDVRAIQCRCLRMLMEADDGVYFLNLFSWAMMNVPITLTATL
jgi:TIR domain